MCRYMPFDDNAWSDRKLIPYLAMLEKVQAVYPDVVRLRNSPNDTAKTYHVPGFQGKFGFITSMTQHFCGGCNRLRLTADGNIKVCSAVRARAGSRDRPRVAPGVPLWL